MLDWYKSSYSSGNGQCTMCARLPDGGMAVKDSKDANSPVLRFSAAEWQAFVAGVNAGEFS
jgi:predicted secreted Zn-dependent protease